LENKARYTLVGIFVLSFSVAMILFLLWLARYDMNKDNLKEYHLYMKESISGLKEKSIVYYKGLEVGKVNNIRINPKNIEEIEIILNLSKPNLIKTDTFAKIESQGVTGNKIIELSGGTEASEVLKKNDNGLLIIPIQNTFLDNLTQSATNIGDKTSLFLNKLNTLLNEKNLKNFEVILSNANNSTKRFDNIADNINNSTKNFDSIADNINVLINKNIKESLNNLNEVTKNIDNLGSNVNQLINTEIKSILQEFKITVNSSQNIDEVMNEFQNTLIKVNNTIDNINTNSGNMIFQTREIKYGPGEENKQ